MAGNEKQPVPSEVGAVRQSGAGDKQGLSVEAHRPDFTLVHVDFRWESELVRAAVTVDQAGCSAADTVGAAREDASATVQANAKSLSTVGAVGMQMGDQV